MRRTLGIMALSGFAPIAMAQGTLTVVETEFRPPAPLFFGNFGNDVAARAGFLVVGSPEVDVFFPSRPGSAHLYRRDGLRWSFLQSLVPSDGELNDGFGTAVWTSGEENTTYVGAPNAGGSGTVYVYERRPGGDRWVELEKSIPAGLTSGARFGHSVAGGVGGYVAGAPFDSTHGSGRWPCVPYGGRIASGRRTGESEPS